MQRLVSLTAGALGAREVTMTDQVLFMAQYNLEANFGTKPEIRQRFRLRPLKWGDPALMAATEPPFDLILGSDIMYHSAHYEVLAETIAGLAGPGTTVLWATPDWPEKPEDLKGHKFADKLLASGFTIRDLSEDPVPKDIVQQVQGVFSSYSYLPYGRGPVRVIEISLPSADATDSAAAPNRSRL